MGDDIKRDEDESSKPLDDKLVESRRKFTKAGLGGGAVLMSLLSRPALGTGYNDPRCTGSIMASIDAGSSLHGFDASECRFGCNIRFWCEDAPAIAWQRAGAARTTSFNSVFPCQNGLTTVWRASPGLLEVLLKQFKEAGNAIVSRAARETVAAWLNAGIFNAGADSYFEKDQSYIRNQYCGYYDSWKSGVSGSAAALDAWADEMHVLNNRSCPLSHSDDQYDMFYYPAG